MENKYVPPFNYSGKTTGKEDEPPASFGIDSILWPNMVFSEGTSARLMTDEEEAYWKSQFARPE